MRNKQDRPAEYRRLALAADQLAESSVLENVREKHLAAAAKWMALAVLDETPGPRAPAAVASDALP